MSDAIRGALDTLKELEHGGGTPVEGHICPTCGQAPTRPFKVGETILCRTVTFYHVGKVIGFRGRQFVTLGDAAWIPDTGKFVEAVNAGQFAVSENLPGPIHVNYESIVDWIGWPHKLPVTAKRSK